MKLLYSAEHEQHPAFLRVTKRSGEPGAIEDAERAVLACDESLIVQTTRDLGPYLAVASQMAPALEGAPNQYDAARLTFW